MTQAQTKTNFGILATPIGGGHPGDGGRLEAALRGRPPEALRPACVAHGPARENLDRLFADGTLCVTTGQQPCLFLGPLLVLYKALTAAALARKLEEQLNRAVVPVFWVGGDDHDFAEINHTHVLSASNEVVRLTLRERDPQAALTPAYQEVLGPAIRAVVEQLKAATPETDFQGQVLEWLGRHYRPEADFATAFAGALAELLGEFGVVTLSPTHLAAKRAMAPWLVSLLEHARVIETGLVERAAELNRNGQGAPVSVGDGATMVMLEGALGRDRLVLKGERFVTRRGGEDYSLADLQRIIETQPQRLSPNVLGRPVLEAALLPTVAYVGGPAELDYLAQAAPVYRVLGVARQAVVPRWSGSVIETRIQKVLDKYGITPADLALSPGQLEAQLLADELPPRATQALKKIRETVSAEYDALIAAAQAVDPTLRKPLESTKNAALAGASDSEKRLLTHLKKQNEILVTQLSKARTNLFPLGQPQERVLNAAPFLIRYGEGFPDQMLAACAAHADALETRIDPP